MHGGLALIVMLAGCASVLPEIRETREHCAARDRVRVPDEDGNPPLHKAAALGDLAAVTTCLEHGADPNQLDIHGSPPLRYASKWGHLDALARLLRAGPKVDLASSEDGETPLMTAAAGGQIKAVRMLLDHGAAVGARDHRNQTALHHAVDADSPDVTYLCQGPNTSFEIEERPKKNAPITALLIARGAPLNLADVDGDTALHNAVMRGALPVTRELLAAGADATLRDHKGRTPLDIARARAGVPPDGSFLADDRREILRLLESATTGSVAAITEGAAAPGDVAGCDAGARDSTAACRRDSTTPPPTPVTATRKDR